MNSSSSSRRSRPRRPRGRRRATRRSRRRRRARPAPAARGGRSRLRLEDLRGVARAASCASDRGACCASQSANAARKRARLRSTRNRRKRMLRRGPRAVVDHRRRVMHVDARESHRHVRPACQSATERLASAYIAGKKRWSNPPTPSAASRRSMQARRARVVDRVQTRGRARRQAAARAVAPDDRAVLRGSVAEHDARGDRAGVGPLAQRLQQARGAAGVQLGVLVDDAHVLGARLAQREVPAADDADVVSVVEDPRAVRGERARVRAHLLVGVVEHEQQLGVRGLRRDRAHRGRGAVDAAREDDGVADLRHRRR